MFLRRKYVAACLLAIFATGCNQSPSNRPSSAADNSANGYQPPCIGIVDLDRVATDLGWMSGMKNNLAALQGQLNDQLAQIRGDFQKEIQEKMEQSGVRPGKKLSPEQQHALQELLIAAQREMSQVQSNANQQFQDYRLRWVKQYRDAIGPIVRDVATEHRIVAVFENSDQLLYHATAIDLTDEVSDAARAHPPMLSPVPVPTLAAPESLPPVAATQPAPTPPAASQPAALTQPAAKSAATQQLK
jgi:Skp family chaperone for outer membrane proteins